MLQKENLLLHCWVAAPWICVSLVGSIVGVAYMPAHAADNVHSLFSHREITWITGCW